MTAYAAKYPDCAQLEPYETPGAIESICENYNRAVDTGIVDVLLLIPVFIKDLAKESSKEKKKLVPSKA